MHIAFFTDVSPATLGGMQTSVNLQRSSLERAGHTVTVCAPRTKLARAAHVGRAEDLALPSIGTAATTVGLAGRSIDRLVDEHFARLAPVDVVHLHADNVGAWTGTRFARRHELPVVHTFHTDINAGVHAAVPLPRLALRVLYSAQGHFLQVEPARNIAGFFRTASSVADAIVVPTDHFAAQVRDYGIERDIAVIPTGVDDDWARAARRTRTPSRARPVLVWPGRMSGEKRPHEAIEAFVQSGVDADLVFYGAGAEEQPCRRLVTRLGTEDRVHFAGRVDQETLLRVMADADGVLQTSIGFETQGLTVFESISVGTPVIVRDPDIAAGLPRAWTTAVGGASVTELAGAIRSWASADRPSVAPDSFLQGAYTARTVELYEKTIRRLAGRRDEVALAGSVPVTPTTGRYP